MKCFFYCLFFAILLQLTTLNISAQNTATWQIWSDIDGNLTKQSDFTTDSIAFTRSQDGRLITLAFEARVPFGTATTRRLQISIPNFTGVGTYVPVLGNTTFWENFTQDSMCACLEHGSNEVVVTKYDSAKSEISGRFAFKCRSLAKGSGTELFSRVRFGTFAYFGGGKIAIETLPKDTLRIANINADTTIPIKITASLVGASSNGITIFVNDKTATPTEFFSEVGAVGNDGTITYNVNLKKNAPFGEYAVKFYADKPPAKGSDTVTVLIRYGNRYYQYKCLDVPILDFDAGEGKEWKPISEGSPILSSDGPVTIGGVFKVLGKVRINSTAGQEKVFIDAPVVIPNVSFQGEPENDFDVSEWFADQLPLPDCGGLIALDTSGSKRKLGKTLPGGIEVEISKLKLINRADAKGVTVTGKISMSNTRNGCEEVVDSTGGFDLTDPGRQSLEIEVSVTNNQGFEALKFKAEKIALTNSICAEEIVAQADFLNAVYGLGGKIKFPIKNNAITMGGFVQFKGPETVGLGKLALDSIAISAELENCFPIGQTPLCFKSVSLSASSMAKPTWDGFKFNTTVKVLTLDQKLLEKVPALYRTFDSLALFELEGSATYQHPLIISGSLTTRIAKLKAISAKKPWQLEAKHEIIADLNNSLTLNGSYSMGHLGGEDFMLVGTGSVVAAWNPDVRLSGTLNGQISIPTPGEQILEVKFIGSVLKFLKLSGFIPQNLGTGAASMSLQDTSGFKISSSIDVSQNPVDAIRSFGRMSVELQVKDTIRFTMKHDTIPVNRNGFAGKTRDEVQGALLVSNEIIVDDDVEKVFAIVSGSTIAPASHLLSPSGTRFDSTSSDGMVKKFNTPSGEMTMWTLTDPTPGIWKLEVPTASATDELEVTANRKVQTFEINASQTGKSVTITWPAQGSTNSDVIRLFLDTDSAQTNGVLIGEAPASLGTFTYALPDELTNCSYYAYGTRIVGSQPIVSDYASTVITGSSPVPAPLQVLATATAAGKTNISWTMAQGSNVQGFHVLLVREDGTDSIIASGFSGQRLIEIQIENHESKKIALVAFNADGIRSCKTEAVSIITSVDNENLQFVSNTNNVLIVPNPTTDATTIKFTSEQTTEAEIEIVNSVGQRIWSAGNIRIIDGWNSILWNANDVQPGTYFVRIKTNSGFSVGIISVTR